MTKWRDIVKDMPPPKLPKIDTRWHLKLAGVIDEDEYILPAAQRKAPADFWPYVHELMNKGA